MIYHEQQITVRRVNSSFLVMCHCTHVCEYYGRLSHSHPDSSARKRASHLPYFDGAHFSVTFHVLSRCAIGIRGLRSFVLTPDSKAWWWSTSVYLSFCSEIGLISFLTSKETNCTNIIDFHSQLSQWIMQLYCWTLKYMCTISYNFGVVVPGEIPALITTFWFSGWTRIYQEIIHFPRI